MSSSWTSASADVLRAILLAVPKALLFAAILVAGWFIAKAVRKLTAKVLGRVGFNRLVERGGVQAALVRSGYEAGDIVARIVFAVVLLLTLQLAFAVWEPNPISDLIAALVAWLPRAFVAVLIVVVAAAVARAVRDIVAGVLGGLSYGRATAGVASAFVLGLGLIAALNQVGVATSVTTPVLIAVLATISGVLIVGVGGGLIQPMQRRWEAWLTRAEQEAPLIAQHARTAARSRAAPATAEPAPGSTPAEPVPGSRPAATPVFSDTAADVTQPVHPAVPPAAEATRPVPGAVSPAPHVTQPVRTAESPDATQPVPRAESPAPDTTQPVPTAPGATPAPRAVGDEQTMVIPTRPTSAPG